MPETLNRLAEERDLVHRLGQPGAGGLDGRLLRKAAKAFARRPTTYAQCVQRAREVFEAHYKRKALSLLHTYPLDMVVDENTKSSALATVCVHLHAARSPSAVLEPAQKAADAARL